MSQNIKHNKIAGEIKNNTSATYVNQSRPFNDDIENNSEIDSTNGNGLSMPVVQYTPPQDGSILIFEGSGNDLVFANYPVPTAAPSATPVKQLITWTYNYNTNRWEAEFSQLNPQKFVTLNYVLTQYDDGYSIIVTNGTTAGTITIPEGLPAGFQVGILQEGTGDITIVADPAATLPITINNAIGGYKIKGQYDSVFIEQGQTPQAYYLLGNTKV